MSEPKPCPFCGHVGLDFREGSTFRWVIAECAGCGAGIGETRIQTLGDGTKEEWMAIAKQDAVDAWNRRAALAAQPGSVGEPVASVRVEGGMMRGATRRPGMASLPDGDHKLYAAAPTESKPAQQDAVDAAYEACAQIAFDADHMGSVNMKLMKNRIGNAIRAAISAKKVGKP